MPPPASTLEQAVLALAEQRPMLRARDLAVHGLPTTALSRLVAAGRLERVARGVYSLPGRTLSEHRSRRGRPSRAAGIVCLLSALRVHGIGTQAPFEVWIAIPHNSPTPRLDQPALRAIRMSGTALSEGVEPMQIDGVNVPVFKCSQDHCRLLQIPQQDRLGRRAGSATRRMDAAQGDS